MRFPSTMDLIIPNFNFLTIVGIIIVLIGIIIVFMSGRNVLDIRQYFQSGQTAKNVKLLGKGMIVFIVGVLMIWIPSIIQDIFTSDIGMMIAGALGIIAVVSIILFAGRNK